MWIFYWLTALCRKGFLGANLEFRKLVGLGFTVGNLVSISTSLNIMDKVSLILGIYAGEHELFGPMDYPNYTIGSNDFDIVGQIRIDLSEVEYKRRSYHLTRRFY